MGPFRFLEHLYTRIFIFHSSTVFIVSVSSSFIQESFSSSYYFSGALYSLTLVKLATLFPRDYLVRAPTSLFGWIAFREYGRAIQKPTLYKSVFVLSLLGVGAEHFCAQHSLALRSVAAVFLTTENKKDPLGILLFSVGLPGVEPGLHDPQPCVIPLYHSPLCTDYILMAAKMSNK